MSRAALLASVLAPVLAPVFALTLTLTGPAAAQTEAEVIGRYPVTVEPQPGSVCQAGQASFEVHRIGGELMEISLDGTRTVADWNPAQKTFAGTIPFPDGDHLVRLDGTFVRSSDLVTVVVQVEFPPNQPCKATLSGSIPATQGAASPTPPPPVLGGAPAPSGPPVFGVSPNDDPVVMPPVPARPAFLGLKDAPLVVGSFLVMLIAGGVIGYRRKRAARTAVQADAPQDASRGGGPQGGP